MRLSGAFPWLTRTAWTNRATTTLWPQLICTRARWCEHRPLPSVAPFLISFLPFCSVTFSVAYAVAAAVPAGWGCFVLRERQTERPEFYGGKRDCLQRTARYCTRQSGRAGHRVVESSTPQGVRDSGRNTTACNSLRRQPCRDDHPHPPPD